MNVQTCTRTGAAASFALLSLFTGFASATEGGGTLYPNGAENFTAGAMPPPGTYGMLFAEHYSADRVNDAGGTTSTSPISR